MSVGFGMIIGIGILIVELEDLIGCDFIFVIGVNLLLNYLWFIYKLKVCWEWGGYVVVINLVKEFGFVKFVVFWSLVLLFGGGSDIVLVYL